jgi:hypothetical protein
MPLPALLRDSADGRIRPAQWAFLAVVAAVGVFLVAVLYVTTRPAPLDPGIYDRLDRELEHTGTTGNWRR